MKRLTILMIAIFTACGSSAPKPPGLTPDQKDNFTRYSDSCIAQGGHVTVGTTKIPGGNRIDINCVFGG